MLMRLRSSLKKYYNTKIYRRSQYWAILDYDKTIIPKHSLYHGYPMVLSNPFKENKEKTPKKFHQYLRTTCMYHSGDLHIHMCKIVWHSISSTAVFAFQYFLSISQPTFRDPISYFRNPIYRDVVEDSIVIITDYWNLYCNLM